MLRRVAVANVAGAMAIQMVINPKQVTHFCEPVGSQVGKTLAALVSQDTLIGMELAPMQVASFYMPGDLRQVLRDDPRSEWGGQKIWLVVQNVRSAVAMGNGVRITFVDGTDLQVQKNNEAGDDVLDDLAGAGRD